MHVLKTRRSSDRKRKSFAGHGASDFPVDPDLNGAETEVFWQIELDTSVVALIKARDEVGLSTLTIDSRHAAMLGPDAYIAFELTNGERQQIVLPKDESKNLAALIPLNEMGFDRLEAVYRLLSALHGRKVPRDRRVSVQQLARFRQMMRAADATEAGATQREIARVLFGPQPEKRSDWHSASARYAVRRMLQDMQNLIDGGYRGMLSKRRALRRKS